MNETRLILSCQKGQKEAFNKLIRLYYPYVSKFLRKLTKDEKLSEDLVQETFVRLIRGIDRYDVKGEGSFSSYLMTIAKNCYFDYLRKNKKALTAINEFAAIDSTLPEERLLNKIEMVKIMEEIDNLPYEQGEAIRLKYLERYTLKEIAERFGTKPKTVKSRIHSGISKLRAKFANE